MDAGRLDKDLISQPEHWKLTLMLSADRLVAALYPPVNREEMIWRSFDFDRSAPGTLRALEDIIYDNPLLLSDFKRVDCIIDNVPSLLLPSRLPEEAIENAYRKSVAGASESGEMELFPSGDNDVTVTLVQDPMMRSFITRTFYNVRFDSRIAALCRFFTGRAEAPQSPAVYAIDSHRRLTVIATDAGHHILMANEFSYSQPVDAAYYLLASMQHLELDPATTAVSISSPASSPDTGSLQQMLQPYLPLMGALPFPTLRYRASKTTLQAPFDLLIRPICE